MTDLCRLIFWTLVDLMRARAKLEAEIWVLRQQINVLRRAAPRRQSFGIFDRLIFVGLYRLFPKACGALAIVKPDTIIRWHPRGFQGVLALEVETLWWPTNGPAGGAQAYPRHEHCQSAVGSAADPWRVAHARRRNRADECGQVYGQEARTTVARLEDFPSQSCGWDRCDRSVRRADNLISFALWLVDCGAWSKADFVAWHHIASNRRMDRKSDHGSLRLGTSSPHAPVTRAVATAGRILDHPILGGLHHQYVRIQFAVFTAGQLGTP